MLDPTLPAPELFEEEDARVLAGQAAGHGLAAMLTVLRVYGTDGPLQRHGLEALARLVTDGRGGCDPRAVADLGGCEVVVLALQVRARA